MGYLDLAGCMMLGATGPVLRATGCPWTCQDPALLGYEQYDFDVCVEDSCDFTAGSRSAATR